MTHHESEGVSTSAASLQHHHLEPNSRPAPITLTALMPPLVPFLWDVCVCVSVGGEQDGVKGSGDSFKLKGIWTHMYILYTFIHTSHIHILHSHTATHTQILTCSHTHNHQALSWPLAQTNPCPLNS